MISLQYICAAFADDDTTAVCVWWALDRVQGRPGHQVEADPRASSRLWLPDDGTERSGRADPSEGHASPADLR